MKSVRQIIAVLRDEYLNGGLNEKDISADPIDQFEKWLTEAVKHRINMPNAMHLATADSEGRPSGRMLLLKGFDERGFIFFSSYESRKGSELENNRHAAMTFFWSDLYRQVRIEGEVFKLPGSESDDYFASRPRESKISTLASEQSRTLISRELLELKFDELEKKFKGRSISRPSGWGGYCLAPSRIEFWQGRAHRLHDRIVYLRDNAQAGAWRIVR
jgi:pyridoxamine 5'-phosphate oxidase